MARALIASAHEEAFLDALSLAETLPKQEVAGLMNARAAHVAASEELADVGLFGGGVESGMSHSLPKSHGSRRPWQVTWKSLLDGSIKRVFCALL
jgi:hypothetical protein